MEFIEYHTDSIEIFQIEKYINNLVMRLSSINKRQSAFRINFRFEKFLTIRIPLYI
jgi:hypothetical protein